MASKGNPSKPVAKGAAPVKKAAAGKPAGPAKAVPAKKGAMPPFMAKKAAPKGKKKY